MLQHSHYLSQHFIKIISEESVSSMANEQLNDQQFKQQKDSKAQKHVANFKQMFKIQTFKKQKKFNHQSREFKDSSELRILFQKKSIVSQVKLPLQNKLFHENSSRDSNIYIPSKNSHILIFPSVNFNEQQKSQEPKAANSTNRLQFFRKLRETSLRKIKEEADKLYKRKQRRIKSRHSSFNFSQQFTCRTITPLENEGLSNQHYMSLREQMKSYNKQEKKRSNSRYEDIPISQFIYDSNPATSKEHPQATYQSKLAKICRKKSMSKRQLSFMG